MCSHLGRESGILRQGQRVSITRFVAEAGRKPKSETSREKTFRTTLTGQLLITVWLPKFWCSKKYALGSRKRAFGAALLCCRRKDWGLFFDTLRVCVCGSQNAGSLEISCLVGVRSSVFWYEPQSGLASYNSPRSMRVCQRGPGAPT